MAKDINVGGRLHSIATGNVIAGADEIFDDNLGKKQTQINTETYNLVESINNALDELSPDQQEALAVAAKANANEAKLGYYVCDTDADTAAKTVVATNYVLGVGGSIKLKMTNDNTVDNATLNINSTGAKPLFYEGARASSTNTWADDDVLEIYYDGTNYQAKNVSPTFKTGEKVNSVGVDNEPTAGSENAVKSGGVIKGLEYTLDDTALSNIQIENNGISHFSQLRVSTVSFIQKKIKIIVNTGSTFQVRLYTFNIDGTVISSGTFTSSIEISDLSYLYKIVFRKADNSSISPSDVIQNITISYPTEDKIFKDISDLNQVIGTDGLIEEDITSNLEDGYYVTTVGEPIGEVVSSSTRKSLLISNLEGYTKFYIKAKGGSTGKAFAKVSNGIITEVGWGTALREEEIEVDGTFDEILFNVDSREEYEIKSWKRVSIDDRLNLVEEKVFSLKDKNIVILGDSSVAASNWAQRMCIDLNFNDYYINAVGGRTITTKITDGVLGNCLRKSIEYAINHIDNTWGGKVDLIMMQIGGNDIGHITGSLEDAFSNTNYLYYKDDTTTWGSARYCYELLKRKYPTALITAGTVFGRIGSNWDGNASTINTLIKEMAQRFCLQIIDGNSYCGFAPILEPSSPYYNDGNPGVADDRSNLTRENPAYNYVDSGNNIVTYAEATIDGQLKEGYTKRYGLYTYDGKHQNLQGEEKVLKFMKAEVIKLFG